MKTMMLKAAIAGTAATLTATAIPLDSAQATTFHLTTNNIFKTEKSSSFFYEKDGIGLTVTAKNSLGSADVYRAIDGSGVQSGSDGADSFLGDSNQVDGGKLECKLFVCKEKEFFETLTLSFDHAVTMVSATFSRVGFNDDFTVLLDGSFLVSENIPGIGFKEVFDEFPDHVGSVFDFTVTDKDDGYFLKKVKVEKVVADVPEPALMLGLGSVAAAGFLAGKRSRKEEVA